MSMMEPKDNKTRSLEGVPELPRELTDAFEVIARQYAPVLKALARY
jgi:hypothetical protein